MPNAGRGGRVDHGTVPGQHHVVLGVAGRDEHQHVHALEALGQSPRVVEVDPTRGRTVAGVGAGDYLEAVDCGQASANQAAEPAGNTSNENHRDAPLC